MQKLSASTIIIIVAVLFIMMRIIDGERCHYPLLSLPPFRRSPLPRPLSLFPPLASFVGQKVNLTSSPGTLYSPSLSLAPQRAAASHTTEGGGILETHSLSPIVGSDHSPTLLGPWTQCRYSSPIVGSPGDLKSPFSLPPSSHSHSPLGNTGVMGVDRDGHDDGREDAAPAALYVSS